MINVCHSHQFYFLNTRFIELNKPRSNVSTESLYVLIAIHIKTATITIEKFERVQLIEMALKTEYNL